LCKHTITKSSNFQCVGLTHNQRYATGTSYLICARAMQPTAAAGRRTTFVAGVFCHVCLHSNFDIGFAISDVDLDTNKKVDISENMFL